VSGVTSAILTLDNISVSYRTAAGLVPAVTSVSLELAAGESLGLVGESGCGKSTIGLAIMRHLGRAGELVGGRILLRGRDMSTLTPEALRRARGGECAMVYQEPMSALNPCLTIGEQLAEVPLAHGERDPSAARRRAVDMLTQVHLPDPLRTMTAYPHQLSGGQQQRVVIAMALLANPSIVILDEPTTGLDVTIEAGIVDLIANLSRRYGTALLYISHNLGLIARVCSRVAVMYSGEIVESGPVADVFAAPRHPYAQGLLRCLPRAGLDKRLHPLRPIRGSIGAPQDRPSGCRFAPRCDFFAAGRCDAGPVALDADGQGRAVRCLRWTEITTRDVPLTGRHDERPPESVLLEVDGLAKHYEIATGGLAALLPWRRTKLLKANDNLAFRVRRHQVLAVVGESGCGKSTLARVLMGLETATAGRAESDGIDLAALPVERRSPAQLRLLQMVFQNPDETLNPSYSVGAQIGRVIRKFGIARRRGEIRDEVERLLALTRMPPGSATRRPGELSGGQKQRVGIARAFAGNPAMIVADEPVSALDVSVSAAIVELLLDLQRERGTTLLVISHDLGLVRYIADRVVVMYLGQVMEVGTAAEMFAPPWHPYTEALLSTAPSLDAATSGKRIVLQADIPSAMDPPSGCPFHTRCPRKLGPICENVKPVEQRTSSGRRISCHIPIAELDRVQAPGTRDEIEAARA
jgi:peptide/nickel transport system ATP-binding protein